MATPKRMLKKDIIRLCRYISGLLRFYGVINIKELHRIVLAVLPCPEDYDEFRDLLEKVSQDDLTDDAMFDLDNEKVYYLSVDDPEWVLSEQAARPNLDYFPIDVEETIRIGGEEEAQLLGVAEVKLRDWLMENGETEEKYATAFVIELQEQINNDCRITELLKQVQRELDIQSLHKLQELMQLFQDLNNQTPLWVLKGWKPSTVFNKFEKPQLRPLPPMPFSFPAKLSLLPSKISPNNFCPCGSGKKYKKCCMEKLSQ